MLWIIRLVKGARAGRDEVEEGDMMVVWVGQRSFGGMMRIGPVGWVESCWSAAHLDEANGEGSLRRNKDISPETFEDPLPIFSSFTLSFRLVQIQISQGRPNTQSI